MSQPITRKELIECQYTNCCNDLRDVIGPECALLPVLGVDADVADVCFMISMMFASQSIEAWKTQIASVIKAKKINIAPEQRERVDDIVIKFITDFKQIA